jgi:hypothetical protein
MLLVLFIMIIIFCSSGRLQLSVYISLICDMQHKHVDRALDNPCRGTTGAMRQHMYRLYYGTTL